MDDRYYCGGKSLLTHFVMKHHHYEAGTRKKRPASWVFFFLPAFGQCCPSVSAHLAKVLLCTENVCTKVPLALWSVLAGKSHHNHLTGEAFLASYLYIVRTSTPACSLQSNSTFSFKHHLTGEAWPAWLFSPRYRLTGNQTPPDISLR